MQKIETITDRVRRMELYFDTIVQAVHNDIKMLQDPPIKAMLDSLTAYCDSGQWLSDFRADERGELPQDLKRGVL